MRPNSSTQFALIESSFNNSKVSQLNKSTNKAFTSQTIHNDTSNTSSESKKSNNKKWLDLLASSSSSSIGTLHDDHHEQQQLYEFSEN